MSSPDDELGEVEGVTLVWDSVEVRDGVPVIRLSGVRSALTDRLDAEFHEAMEAWGDVVREAVRRGERPSEPPPQPGERLELVEVSVTDDVGTQYVVQSRAVAGSGTEWEGEWRFGPAVPREATQLTVRVRLPDGSEQERALPLSEPRAAQ
jgi:hypothetical protein